MTEHEVLQLLDNAVDYFGLVMQDKDVDTAETQLALDGLNTAWRLAQDIRQPQTEPMTAEQIAQVMDDYLQKVEQVAQVPAGILDGTTITGSEPPLMPAIAHLGEIVHVRFHPVNKCYAAITAVEGQRPTLTIFNPVPVVYKLVNHFETSRPATDYISWHCACECAQATAAQ